MIETIINAYRFNLKYAQELVSDIDEKLMTKSGGNGLENHPAFTLGHLVTAAALTSKYLGGPYKLPGGWEELFRRKGPGDPRRPSVDSTLYPTKQKLLAELHRQHDLVEKLMTELDDIQLNLPVKWRFHHHLGTMADLLIFMCITHESMHLGQLAAWRRFMGVESALARL